MEVMFNKSNELDSTRLDSNRSWCFGALVLWCFGALVLWCNGALMYYNITVVFVNSWQHLLHLFHLINWRPIVGSGDLAHFLLNVLSP